MHVAIYDDNIADRKQTERLMGRESDRLKAEGNEGFFIDSYGNIEALMRFPQMYGLFIIDTSYSEETGLDIAKLLIDEGCTGQIVLLTGARYDYRKLAHDKEPELEGRFHYLEKPIRVSDLKDILSECKESAGEALPALELRDDNTVIRAHQDEIIYAASEESLFLKVVLTDNRIIKTMSDPSNFLDECMALGMNAMCAASFSCVINVNHIVSMGMLRVELSDGTTVKLSPLHAIHINKVRTLIHRD